MIQWNDVTWYSRLGAITVFIGALPALSFYVGTQYEASTPIQNAANSEEKLGPGQPPSTFEGERTTASNVSLPLPRPQLQPNPPVLLAGPFAVPANRNLIELPR
jgi:hypothetical protein